MPNLIYNYTTGNNYTFDSNKIEVAGGIAKLLASSGTPEAYMYVTMDDNVVDNVFRDLSGNSRDGALKGGYTGDVNKVPAKINNGLIGLSATLGFVDFGSQDFNFERTESFSFECWVKYSSTTTQILLSKQKAGSPFTGVSLLLLSGKIAWSIYDLNGNGIVIQSNANYNDNDWHHVVATYDGSSLVTGMNLFIDNVIDKSIFASDVLDSTIITNSIFQISGREGNNVCLLNTTTIDECVVYNRELTAAEVAFRWNGGAGTQELPGPGVSYPVDNPTIIPKQGFQATEFIDFDVVETIAGSDNIGFVIVVNGVDMYWNGSSWVESTGYAESNTSADIKANITSLVLTDVSSINFKAYLHSNDGSTTPELDSVSFEFNAEPSNPVLTQSTITGNVYDIGAITSDITISIKPVSYLYGTNTIITNAEINVIYDADTGAFTATIYVEDDLPDELIWKFGSKEVRTTYLSGNIKFSSLDRIYP